MNFVTQNAREKFNQIKNEIDTRFLRVIVNPGGCSGFYYDFQIDNTLNENDVLLENDVVIDKESYELLEGSFHIDTNQDYIKDEFKLIIPQSTTSCGCGKGFNVI